MGLQTAPQRHLRAFWNRNIYTAHAYIPLKLSVFPPETGLFQRYLQNFFLVVGHFWWISDPSCFHVRGKNAFFRIIMFVY